ncbi:MAG: GNAT family N-acetyltransferase [Puniceicoccaceae bacterium]
MSALDPILHLRTNFETIIRKAGGQTLPELLESTDNFIRCLTGLPHPLGNIVIVRNGDEGHFKEVITEVESRSAEQSFPAAAILFPDVNPDSFATILEERGWVLMDKMPGMWMEIPEGFSVGSLAEGVDVRHASDEDALAIAVALLAEGYPIPFEVSEFFMRGIHLEGEQSNGSMANFIATVDGEPAACSSVCIEDGVAGIYCVATLEKARGRGLGTAITRAAVEYGRKHGANHALLHATEMGEPIYQKIGFVEKSRIPAYGFGLG